MRFPIPLRCLFVLLAAVSAASAQVPALFQAEPPWDHGWGYANPIAMDIDRDGYLDLAVVGYDSTSEAVLATYMNDGKNGWATSRLRWTGRKFEGFGSPSIADLDGDDRPELLVLRGARDPWFVPDFPAEGAQAVREGDLRLVDSLDPKQVPRHVISYAQGGHGYLSWTWGSSPRDYGHHYEYRPEFSDLAAQSLPFNMTRLIQADFNMDGRPDAVFVQGYGGTDTNVYRRSGPGGYENIGLSARSMWGGSHEAGDWDNDGDLDIVSCGYTPTGSGNVNFRAFFENQGDTLAEVGFDRGGPADGACLLADFDNDGDLDLLSIGKYMRTQIHRNVSSRKNAPPTVPQGLSVAGDSGRVHLSWRRSRDDLTRSAGLSYNVRIGTAPDRGDVLLAAADPESGRLLTPHLGNNGTDTVRTLYTRASNYQFPLPAGRYYWTVQAVDNGYAASAFAPPQSFEISEGGAVRLGAAARSARKPARIPRLRPGRGPGSVALDGRRLH